MIVEHPRMLKQQPEYFINYRYVGDVSHLLPPHERHGHTKWKFILKIRVGRCKFTWDDMEIPHIGRYGGLIWHNFGFQELDAQAAFPLSTSEGQQID